MDGVYRHQRHFYDATRRFYLLGRDKLISEVQPPQGGSVLEIGCGTGRNLIALAKRYPSAQCFGVDISTAMLKTARGAVARADLNGRVQLGQGDATRLTPWPVFGVKQFDRVIFSYTLSMIPEWRQAIAEAINVLSPGGRLHVVDFGTQAGLPGWFRWALLRWLKLFHVAPRNGLSEELHRRAVAAGFEVRIENLYRGYATYAVIRPMKNESGRISRQH